MTEKDFKRKFEKFLFRLCRKEIYKQRSINIFKINNEMKIEFLICSDSISATLEDHTISIIGYRGHIFIKYLTKETQTQHGFYDNLLKIINTNKKRAIFMNELFIDVLC